jgi:hypothetical protein
MNTMRKNSNPRITLKGNSSPTTALRCRNEEILSGNRDGEIKLFNLKHGPSQTAVCYNYHRK